VAGKPEAAEKEEYLEETAGLREGITLIVGFRFVSLCCTASFAPPTYICRNFFFFFCRSFYPHNVHRSPSLNKQLFQADFFFFFFLYDDASVFCLVYLPQFFYLHNVHRSPSLNEQLFQADFVFV
jgi:hypothetical protein